MKEHILKLIELNPDILYYDLVKIFGLSLKELLKLLEITNYKIDNFNNLIFYDDNGNRIYSEELDGYWQKYEYDTDGNRIYSEDSDGEWVKWEYDANGNNNVTYSENFGDIF